MDTVGFCKIVKKPSEKTKYFWGPITDIAGQELRVVERNLQGDCLCFNEKGLIDVSSQDITAFRASSEAAAWDLLLKVLSGSV